MQYILQKTAIIATKHKSDIKLIKDTPNVTLTDELWEAKNWPRYSGTTYDQQTILRLKILDIVTQIS